MAQGAFQLVVAATRSMGIGKAGQLPWKLSADLKYFKELTSATKAPGKVNAVIMGRKTWESIPSKFRPLPGRVNVVLSRSAVESGAADENANPQQQQSGQQALALPPGVLLQSSLESALATLASEAYATQVESVFVIGGAQVYAEALESPLCSMVHLTEVEGEHECDTFIPPIDASRFRLWAASPSKRDAASGTRFSFLSFVAADAETSKFRAPASPPAAACAPLHAEQQYLDLIREIIEEGELRGDRTGTGTFSKFGAQMRFDLRRSFPLLTTKRTFWRGVAEELLWFVRGSTDAKLLQAKGIHIWDGNGSREFLDKNGLSHREEGDLGPVYGFQWRHFGAAYTDKDADYTGTGVDQLAECIHKIKNNPNDRRIVMTAWNPAALSEMALPPCHMFCQFYVARGELSCQMYQRSCDMGLGVPFNVASYALLTCLIAKVCGLKPGDFVHSLGDAHVYCNHVEPLLEQLKNEPRPFPQLKINADKDNIEDFTFEDLELVGYDPCAAIKMKMAV